MISKNFHRAEVTCKCGCGQDTIDAEVMNVVQDVRDHFNAPVTITSGNRCFVYNFKVGGSKDSQHLLSKALDFKVRGFTSLQVLAYLETKYPGQYGIGIYETFIHVDVREFKARW